MASEKILGISLGTRRMGVVIMEHASIFDYWLKSFNEKWSDKKLQKILRIVEGYIVDYKVHAVAIKLPTLSVDAPAVEELLAGIEKFAESKGIKVYKYGLKDIKKAWAGNRIINKKEFISLVVREYPELKKEYEKEIKNKITHYEKIFEAFAVTKIIENNAH